MNAQAINAVFAVCCTLLGIVLLFAKVDRVRLEKYSHTMPGYALFRFAWFRFMVAAIVFIVGALAYLNT